MAASDVQALLNASYCINNYGPGGWPLIELGLLKQWALAENAAAVTDPAALLALSACYNNYSAQAWLLKLGLERNIINGLSPTTPTDPQSLLDAASCTNNFGGTIALQDLVLLTQITVEANPAAVTDPAALIALGNCYNNYSAQAWLIRLGLLAQISMAVNPSAAVDAPTLLANAQCYNCYGPGLWPLFQVQLLILIKASGGVTPLPAPVLAWDGINLTWTWALTNPPFWRIEKSADGSTGWTFVTYTGGVQRSFGVPADAFFYRIFGSTNTGVPVTGISNVVSAPVGNFRITVLSDFRVTQAGDFRIWQ